MRSCDCLQHDAPIAAPSSHHLCMAFATETRRDSTQPFLILQAKISDRATILLFVYAKMVSVHKDQWGNVDRLTCIKFFLLQAFSSLVIGCCVTHLYIQKKGNKAMRQ